MIENTKNIKIFNFGFEKKILLTKYHVYLTYIKNTHV